MIYVCSDIHGNGKRFYKMLKKIHFNANDTLYILGDVVDRGPDSIRILKYIMKRDNIILLMGNHEDFMMSYFRHYPSILRMDTKETEGLIVPSDCWLWDNNGGKETLASFLKEPYKRKQKILDYLKECPAIVLLDVNKKKYHLSHSGTISQADEKDIWYYKHLTESEKEDVLWNSIYRDDLYLPETVFPKDYTCIFGHVPSQRITGKCEIVPYKNTINIDGGNALSKYYPGVPTALICYCLDTEEAFYIK